MRKLIYPQFIGRLGNNMFQIAACIGYARKHNVGWGIKKGYIERGFNVFQVDKYFPHLPDCDETFRAYNEPHFDYKEIPFHPGGVRIVGFWQSIKYFEHCQDEVINTFRLKYTDDLKDYVSIHVRRGDYTKHAGHFPPVTMEYINKAMYELLSRGHAKFMVFSDDIEWCKQNINGDAEVHFSNGKDEYEDLCMMASCGHNIIANSSFSWMAAFCNRNPEKIVVSPAQCGFNWFGPLGGVKNPATLIPDSWLQIKFR